LGGKLIFLEWCKTKVFFDKMMDDKEFGLVVKGNEMKKVYDGL
jgi:hypothetical protein